MSGAKLSPRQKMIGMMYLVLTALLALNVSKEILNAFVIVNTGLQKTNANFTNKNDVTYNAFDLALLNDEVKVRPYYDKAKAAKISSKGLYDYIEALKKNLMRQVEGNDTISDLAYVNAKDNYDISTHYLVGTDAEHPTGKAVELKNKVDKYREYMLTLIDPKDKANMKIGLKTASEYSIVEEKQIGWINNNFYHNPIAAVLTILSKLQNDVKNAEADIIGTLLKRIDVASFKFDTLAAKVIANTNYVLIGDEYKAEVFMAAYSTTSNPQIVLGQVDTSKNVMVGSVDSTSVKTSRGVGYYTVRPGAEGPVKWGGLIKVKNPADNSVVSYPFKSEYMVARPSAVVSPEKMNVLYIGVDNPLAVSAAGVPAENLVPSLSGGTLSGGRGKYMARVSGPPGRKATVSVSARFGNITKSMGTFEFRVKQIPNPVPVFSGRRGTATISKAELNAAAGVIADLKDFDFDLKFQIVSYDVSATINGIENTKSTQGPALSQDQKNIINKAKVGSKVYIENVKAKGPDGTLRDIGSVILKIQ